MHTMQEYDWKMKVNVVGGENLLIEENTCSMEATFSGVHLCVLIISTADMNQLFTKKLLKSTFHHQ